MLLVTVQLQIRKALRSEPLPILWEKADKGVSHGDIVKGFRIIFQSRYLLQFTSKLLSVGYDLFFLQPFFFFFPRNCCSNPFFDFSRTLLQRSAQALHGHLPVLGLGPALACLGHDARGKMADPHGRVSGIAVLPTWA